MEAFKKIKGLSYQSLQMRFLCLWKNNSLMQKHNEIKKLLTSNNSLTLKKTWNRCLLEFAVCLHLSKYKRT